MSCPACCGGIGWRSSPPWGCPAGWTSPPPSGRRVWPWSWRWAWSWGSAVRCTRRSRRRSSAGGGGRLQDNIYYVTSILYILCSVQHIICSVLHIFCYVRLYIMLRPSHISYYIQQMLRPTLCFVPLRLCYAEDTNIQYCKFLHWPLEPLYNAECKQERHVNSM